MLTDCVKVPSRARLKDLGLEILGYDSAGEVGGGVGVMRFLASLGFRADLFFFFFLGGGGSETTGPPQIPKPEAPNVGGGFSGLQSLECSRWLYPLRVFRVQGLGSV